MKKRFNQLLKGFVAVSAMMIVMAASSAAVYAEDARYEIRNHTRTVWLTQGQYDQFLSVIHESVANGYNGSLNFFDTGIQFDSIEDAKAAEAALESLCPDDNLLFAVNNGFETIELTSLVNENNYHCSYRYSSWDTNHDNYGKIYACWNPNGNAEESLRKMDETIAVLDQVVAQAPEGVVEKCRYFNDWLSERITYDHSLTRTTTYSGICEGTTVCQGYADAFFWLCFRAGVDAAEMPVITQYSTDGQSDHTRNAVMIDGIWRMVDVTWNDLDPGIRYDYFMVPLEEDWQQFLNSAYMVRV